MEKRREGQQRACATLGELQSSGVEAPLFRLSYV